MVAGAVKNEKRALPELWCQGRGVKEGQAGRLLIHVEKFLPTREMGHPMGWVVTDRVDKAECVREDVGSTGHEGVDEIGSGANEDRGVEGVWIFGEDGGGGESPGTGGHENLAFPKPSRILFAYEVAEAASGGGLLSVVAIHLRGKVPNCSVLMDRGGPFQINWKAEAVEGIGGKGNDEMPTPLAEGVK